MRTIVHTRLSAPTEEPLTLEEVKAYLNYPLPDQDALITSLIGAAREVVEQALSGAALLTQLWAVEVEDDTGLLGPAPWFRLPHWPATVTALEQWTGGAYVAVTEDWPITERAHVVEVRLASRVRTRVTYAAGWETAADVPEKYKLMMKLLIGHWFLRRETVGPPIQSLEWAVDALLALDRPPVVGA